MEPNQVQTRVGHQRSQPLHNHQRLREKIRGAVAAAWLGLEHHLPGSVLSHTSVGQSRAGDMAAQLFQRLPVIGAAAHGAVQSEPLHTCEP